MTLETLNALRARSGKTQLSSWKNGKAKLAEAIAKEEALLTAEAEQPAAPSDLTDLDVGQSESQVDPSSPDHPDRPDAATISAEDGTVTEAARIPRGAINAMCVELLQTDMPYEDIVASIKAAYPTAKTTARSLASVAMDLRADGQAVPTRRKPAAAKPAKSE
jgi:hypothetical protein